MSCFKCCHEFNQMNFMGRFSNTVCFIFPIFQVLPRISPNVKVFLEFQSMFHPKLVGTPGTLKNSVIPDSHTDSKYEFTFLVLDLDSLFQNLDTVFEYFEFSNPIYIPDSFSGFLFQIYISNFDYLFRIPESRHCVYKSLQNVSFRIINSNFQTCSRSF